MNEGIRQPNRRQRRNMKKTNMIRQQFIRGNKMQVRNMPPQPQTEEEIEEIIRILEYQRTIMPKYQDLRIVARIDAITKAIQVYRKKLDGLKNNKSPEEKKPNE